MNFNKLKVVVTLLIILVIGIQFFFNNPFVFSQEEFYNNAINKKKRKSYKGVVKKKYIKKNSPSRKKILLVNENFKLEMDFVYEKFDFYGFIQIGDTLIKHKGSLSIQIKRHQLDTAIPLKLDNLRKH